MSNSSIIKVTIGGAIALFALLFISMSIYTVDEGNVGIIKRWGQAINQVEPGLHFKIPVSDEVVEIEIRTRKNVEKMPVATSEQMPAEAVISVNWTVNKASVLDLYKKYGSLDQFENRILDPKLREASKAGISKFTAEQNINSREKVTNKIYSDFLKKISSYPITINSMQYEDIKLPKNYIASISAKQTAKNERDAEKFKLEKQGLEAQRAVNTAKAERDAAKARADGVAYKIEAEAKANAKKITLIADAEAKAIKKKAEALKNNKNLIEYQKALNWDGKLPNTVMGSNPGVIMSIK
jgi:regulator of protease activity HflC (stomatin/prohibitin superfamily)